MSVSLNTVQVLFGNPAKNSGLFGNSVKQFDVTRAFFGANQSNEVTLSESQQSTIAQLQKFVDDNLSGPQAKAVQKDIDGLRELYKANNSTTSFSALSQLLGSNNGSFSNLTSGSLINQLV